MNISNMVSGDKTVKFVCFKHNELWYTTECGFEFPIHISETNGAEFRNEDKAIFFMRWIRKHIKLIYNAKIDNADVVK